MKSFQVQTHYEVLEVAVCATAAEIQSAYDRLIQLYSEAQMTMYGLVDTQQIQLLHKRLQTALEVLLDETRREAYDRSIGLPLRERRTKAETPSSTHKTPVIPIKVQNGAIINLTKRHGQATTPPPLSKKQYGPVSKSPKPYDLPTDVECTGDLLRQIRQRRGLSLEQLSKSTRISFRHLENVERDNYEALPATVYLRGILMNLCRELGLDALRVSKSYLGRTQRMKG